MFASRTIGAKVSALGFQVSGDRRLQQAQSSRRAHVGEIRRFELSASRRVEVLQPGHDFCDRRGKRFFLIGDHPIKAMPFLAVGSEDLRAKTLTLLTNQTSVAGKPEEFG